MSSWKSCRVFFFMMDSQAPMSAGKERSAQAGAQKTQMYFTHSVCECQAHSPELELTQGTTKDPAPAYFPPETNRTVPWRHLRRLSSRCSCFSPLSSWDTKFFICLMSMPLRRCRGPACHTQPALAPTPPSDSVS